MLVMYKMKVNSRDKRIRAGLKGTEINMLPTVIKGMVHPKIVFLSLYLLTHTLSHTCINFFLVLNTKYILKNVENQTVAGPH